MTQIKAAYDKEMRQLTATGAPFELQEQTIDGRNYKLIKSANANLAELYRQSQAAHGDKEFLIYEGERWTFNRTFQQAAAIGEQLRQAYGVQKGDRVAIAMRNYPEWITAFIGITCIGAIAVPLNSWGQARELAFGLADAGAKVVFCDQQRLDLFADRLTEMGMSAVVARPAGSSLPANTVSYDQLTVDSQAAALPEADIASDDLALMMYTSGTTGQPKGALSTHRAICQTLATFDCAGMASAITSPETIGAMMAKGFEPVQMLAVPLFHVSGCHAVFLLALKAGRKIVMLHKWDIQRALQAIESERVTIISAAPSMLMQLLESPEFDRTDTSSLSNLGAGGAATPPRASRLIYEKVPDGFVGTGWGMTETNGIGASHTGEAFKSNPGSAGCVHPIAEIRVCDEQGAELPPGEAGTLWIKSPTLVKEYWHRPEANAKEFQDGWFNSGDIGYLDEDGFLYLSDRAKDMVIRGGENIYPAEIEAAILDHPAVGDAAAFGVPDETQGEQLAVAVVPQAGKRVSEDAIRSFAAEHLARFKVPHYVWIRDEALPRNASGKVLKKNLKEAYASHLGSNGNG